MDIGGSGQVTPDAAAVAGQRAAVAGQRPGERYASWPTRWRRRVQPLAPDPAEYVAVQICYLLIDRQEATRVMCREPVMMISSVTRTHGAPKRSTVSHVMAKIAVWHVSDVRRSKAMRVHGVSAGGQSLVPNPSPK
jgi:hypothetical protein